MRYALRRIALAPLLFLSVSFLTFWGLRLIGSNQDIVAGMLNTNYSEQGAKQLIKELGLDRPFFVQYFSWLGKLLRGDLGTSFYTRDSVWNYMKDGIPTTIQLVIMAMILSLLISMPMGIIAAYRKGTRTDRAFGIFSFGLLSMPGFVLGLLLLLLFALKLKWFPAGQTVPFGENPFQSIRYMFLPALALALGVSANYQRTLRTDMVNSLQEDFVTLAKSKGLTDRYILLRHALRPSSFTLLTLTGITVGALIGNAFIIESIFNVNGVGRKLVGAIFAKDIPVVLSGTMMVTLVFIITTTIVDLLYGVLDPRVRALRSMQ